MEITWYGHSCFRLTERGLATVVTDPYDHKQVGYEPLKLKADIVTISHNTPGHNNLSAVKGDPHLIDGPGEFEIGSVFITGIFSNGHTKKTANEPRNTLFLFDYNGINVLHLGDLNRVPTQTEVEDFGPIHVALVPVGSGGSLNAIKAVEVISMLEPSIVIPMHYKTDASTETAEPMEPLTKFLKEMGLTSVESVPSLKIQNTNSLPDETKVVVLDYQKNNGA
ncbi:MAG: lactamase [Chloroflexi bacterium HGW-Chloroflexi-5]|jgi:L-ascorbate metabolism protein UlaG (beta-lactamase superfamily)|nr:MAG: lactamase [Chloroflexi bacterium HGW-Chloroflexi-5]